MIILIRHGQTAANASGQLQGRSDLALTDLGRRQARAAAAVVPAGARIVTSPLRRAVETAELIAAELNAPGGPSGPSITVDERWTELDYGVYEGRTFAEVPTGVWDRWRSDPDFTPPDGESLRACGLRVRDACSELAVAMASDGADRTDGGEADVVVVSHVSPIKAAVAWCLGAADETAWRMFLDVAAVSRVAIGPRGPSLHSYNERQHLTAAGL